jgi:hypothetical protein
LVIKALDLDWIRIGIQPMLDPDSDEMNADPQPCQKLWGSNSIFSLWTTGNKQIDNKT